VESFDKKAAGKKIKKIKNEAINPYRDAMKDSRADALSQRAAAAGARKGYIEAKEIENQAKEAGVNLDKDTMRRLNKIKSRVQGAINKEKDLQAESNQEYRRNQKNAKDFESGKTAVVKKQRKADYGRGL